jgi:hypothetical protein
MFAKRIFSSLIIGLIVAQAFTVFGSPRQEVKPRKGGWAALAQEALARGDVQAARPVEVTVRESETAEETTQIGIQNTSSKTKLVGTWLMSVPASPGAPAFNALQTFNPEGTMTETSDLLGQLNEGPAHGVWEGKKNDYLLTFQLFAFDPDGNSVGRIRVRVSIHLIDDDNLTAGAVVDFIEPDGTIIPEIGATPYTGTRLKVVAP